MINVRVDRKSNFKKFDERLKKATKLAAYVGVPSTTAEARSSQLLKMAGATQGKKRKRIEKAAAEGINNAEALFIFSKGSPARNQPAREVLDPSIKANHEKISVEIAESVSANLKGDQDGAIRGMNRAALAGQNAARSWFTDPRNGWAPNAARTIKQKGSDRPGIDSGAMRNAIVGVVADE